MRSCLLLPAAAWLLVACTPTAPAPSGETPAPAASVREQDTATTGPVTITFGVSRYELDAYRPLIEQFNRDNPDVQVQHVDTQPIDEAATNSGTFVQSEVMRQYAQAADTFFTWADTGPEGTILDLKPLMDADPTFNPEDFYPAARQTGEKQYIVPAHLQLRLVAYNRDLFAQNGLEVPKTDWTWEDAITAAQAIARTRGDTIQIYGLFSYPFEMPMNVITKLDPTYFTTPSDSGFTTDAVRTALIDYAAWTKAGVLGTQDDTDTFDVWQDRIKTGAIGIWNLSYTPDRDTLPYTIGIATVPTAAGQQSAYISGFAISAGTQHPEAAWRWLSFLSKQPSRSSYRTGVFSILEPPARISVAEQNGYFREMDEETKAAVTHQLQQVQPPEPQSTSRRYSGLYSAVSAIDDGRSVEEALSLGEQAYNEALAAVPAPTSTASNAPIVVATPLPAITAASDATPLRITAAWDDGRLQKMIEQFNRQNPDIFITLEINRPEPGTIMNTRGIAGDIGMLYGLGKEHNLLDLKPLMDADPTFPPGDVLPAAQADFTRDGKLFGLPFASGAPMLAYNKTLLEEAGVPLPGPTITVDELVSAATQLTKGDSYGYEAVSTSMLQHFLSSNGVDVGQLSIGKIPATDPKVRAALVAFADFARAATPSRRMAGYKRDDWTSSYDAVQNGTIAFWESYSVQSEGMSLDPETVGVTILNTGQTPNIYASAFGINATTVHPEAAWRAIAWLSRQPDAPLMNSSFPARRSVFADEAYARLVMPGVRAILPDMLAIQEQVRPEAGETDPAVFDSADSNYWLYQAADALVQDKNANIDRLLADAEQTQAAYLACVGREEDDRVCGKQVDPDYRGVFQPPSD